ncbi:tail fiber domain-containing protein [Pontibacter chitinilyticus]|uniref:tail fiber domain-containing protein n=1 Tax=Pontibacter chitinilyticus TaxID=2674989 RepID=UPI00321B5EDF
MKKTILLLMSLVLLSNYKLMAQNWVNGGNTLSANGSLGTNSNFSLIFKTNNTERGRITNGGNWGIGTSSPGAKLQVNSASGANSFRASINGSTKLLVHSSGGVAIGSNQTPPANGLYVSGNVGFGITTPGAKVHINSADGQYPLRVQANSLTGLLVHNNLGVSVGSAAIPPPNGLNVNGLLTITNGGLSSTNTSATGNGVYGSGYYGVYGSGSNVGVYGFSTGLYGVYGYSNNANGRGVYGIGLNGVYGQTTTGGGNAVYATASAPSAYGLFAASSQAIGVYGYTGNTASYAGYFAGRVYSSGGYISPSDRKLKQNITEMGSAMDIINKLQPKTYEYRQDGNFKLMNLPKGTQYGLIAQDVEQVLPDLVTEATFNTARTIPAKQTVVPDPTQPNATGLQTEQVAELKPGEEIDFKAVNYTELIPILVKAMQEQQQENNVLKARIAKLEAAISGQSAGSKSIGNEIPGVSLEQNYPNPFNQSTTFRYTLPAGATGQILIHEVATGKLIRSIQAPAGGQAQLNAGDLKPGVYTYTLTVNGQVAASKTMMLHK